MGTGLVILGIVIVAIILIRYPSLIGDIIEGIADAID